MRLGRSARCCCLCRFLRQRWKLIFGICILLHFFFLSSWMRYLPPTPQPRSGKNGTVINMTQRIHIKIGRLTYGVRVKTSFTRSKPKVNTSPRSKPRPRPKPKPRPRSRKRVKAIPLRLRSIVTQRRADDTLRADFASYMKRGKEAIPKILHQIYRNASIPNVYIPYIKSWLRSNPDFEYWFWDDRSGRELISKHYPKFLPLFNAYCHDLFRSDAMRYFILHKYGGIYADMDYEAFRNVTPLMENHHCQLVQETGAQAKLLYNSDTMVMNAWMSAVPAHPFMHFLVNSLPSKAKCSFNQVLASTGPLFVYASRDRYYRTTRCNQETACHVHIIPDKHMMPQWDVSSGKNVAKLCRLRRITGRQRSACAVFRKYKFKEQFPIPDTAYATHKFLHIGNLGRNFRANNYTHIRDIVKNAVLPFEH